MRTLALRLPPEPSPPWVHTWVDAWRQGGAWRLQVWPAPKGPDVRPQQPESADVVIDLCPWLPLEADFGERWAVVDLTGDCHAGPWPGLREWVNGGGVTARLSVQAGAGAPWRQGPEVCLSAPPATPLAVEAAVRAVHTVIERHLDDWVRDLRPALGDFCSPPRAPACGLTAQLLRAQGGLLHECRRARERWFTEHWRVGVINQPVHTLLAAPRLPPVRWITPAESEGYWADPFGVPGSDSELLCERFDERTELGHVERLSWKNGQLQSLGRLPVGNGTHVSFPNVFEMDGRVLAVAETGALRECVLHEVQADGGWRPLVTLLKGVAAADPALFCWQGRYWLAYTDADKDVWGNLCLLWAEKLEGPWRPHAFNPVRLDVGGARMAGNFFWHEGQLYRPGQDCRSGYGAGLSIYRVEQCSATTYREVLFRRFAPDSNGAAPAGLHTLNAWGHRTLVDGKSWRFNPGKLVQKLARRIGARPLGKEATT